jgi:hypothetical protein
MKTKDKVKKSSSPLALTFRPEMQMLRFAQHDSAYVSPKIDGTKRECL